MGQPVSDTLAGSTRFGADSAPAVVDERQAFVIAARAELPSPGRFLAYKDDEKLRLLELSSGQLRVGRSLTADVRFEDQTVSRRHALLVVTDDEVRVLDDRSLNGVFVNGVRVETRALADGDELVIGRHRLAYLVMTRVAAGSAY